MLAAVKGRADDREGVVSNLSQMCRLHWRTKTSQRLRMELRRIRKELRQKMTWLQSSQLASQHPL